MSEDNPSCLERLFSVAFTIVGLLVTMYLISLWIAKDERDAAIRRIEFKVSIMSDEEKFRFALDNGYISADELDQIVVDAQRKAGSFDNLQLIDEEIKKQQESAQRQLDSVYKKLKGLSDSGDLRGVMENAQAFLVSANSHQDPRREEVIDAYSKAIVTTLASQDPRQQDAVAEQVRLYRRLVVVPELLQEATGLAATGHIVDALAAVENVRAYDPQTDIAASIWNELCLWGGLWGQAERVTQACNSAVSDADQSYLALYQGNRGISRAQLGDYEGASSDFQALDAWAQLSVDERLTFQRPQQWSKMLESNQNPFATDTLAELRAKMYESLGVSSSPSY